MPRNNLKNIPLNTSLYSVLKEVCDEEALDNMLSNSEKEELQNQKVEGRYNITDVVSFDNENPIIDYEDERC